MGVSSTRGIFPSTPKLSSASKGIAIQSKTVSEGEVGGCDSSREFQNLGSTRRGGHPDTGIDGTSFKCTILRNWIYSFNAMKVGTLFELQSSL